MKKNLLKKLLLTLVCGLLALSAYAQKGSTLLGNFSFEGYTVPTVLTSLPNQGTENSVSLTLTGVTAVEARTETNSYFAPFTYTKAIKVQGGSIEFSGNLSSIGSFEMDVHNGSGNINNTITTSVWDGSAWKVVEEVPLAFGVRLRYTPLALVSKSATRVKVAFSSGGTIRLFALRVYNNTNADGAPAFVSVTPAENSNLPSIGSISVQFDELIKLGTGTPTLGNAVISSVSYKGNTMEIAYSGLTSPAVPVLTIPAASATDFAGNALLADVTKNYAVDVDPPQLNTILPTEGSPIHVNDLGEDARKIKLTFDENIRMSGIGAITFNGATVTPTISGAVLTISYAGLPYSATNTLTIPRSFIEDLSGNRWANGVGDFTADFITEARDNTAPTLDAQSVAESSAQPIGSSIYFTFNEIVQVAAQNATINGQPATLSNNGKVIGLNYTNLPYSTSIQVVISSDCVTDTCGNYYVGKTFAFNTVAQTPKAFDMIVGAGETYTTIQSAIDAITDDTKRTLIYVKNGTYSEKLVVWKNNVSLIGEDANKTIITWNECSSTSTLQSQYNTGISSVGTDASYTMLIKGNNFYGENFTVRNDYDYISGADQNKQAVAIEHITGDKHVLKNVKMYGFQDTYYPKSANTRQYLKDCYILGGTDFIFGSGTCFIDNASIDCFPGGQYITAASDTQKEFGIVLNNCTAQYKDTTTVGTKRQFYLGRPWKIPAKTSYINCAFEDGLIIPAGWSEWSGTTNHLSAVYSEYNSTLIGGGTLPGPRVSWSSQLNATQASRYNVDNAFNYGTSGTWNPIPYTTETAAPTNAQVDMGTRVITWAAPDFAVGYLVFKNGELLGKTADLTYTDPSTTLNENDVYTIKASNEYGALSVAATATATNGTGCKTATINKAFLKSTIINNQLELINADEVAKIEIVDLSGKKVQSTIVTSSVISTSFANGIYLVKGTTKAGEIMIAKIVKK